MEQGQNPSESSSSGFFGFDPFKDKVKAKAITKEFAYRFKNLTELTTNFMLETKIREIISFFYSKRPFISRNELRNIIRKDLPKFCYQRQLKDSQLVSEVLRCIYDVSDEFVASLGMFLLSAMSNRCRINENILREQDRIGEPRLTYLGYFLHHAKRKQLTFSGRRLTDFLLEVSSDHAITTVLYSNTQAVLTLLQYGARFFDDSHNERYTRDSMLAIAIEFIIFCGVNAHQWEATQLNLYSVPLEMPSYIKKMCQNFTLILRTVSNPHTITYKVAGIDLGSERIRIPEIAWLKPFYETLFPGMDYGVMKPSLLTHICRQVIRETLNNNWQLPEGIQKMGLPRALANYVNLEEN